jgi:hypothetical protein
MTRRAMCSTATWLAVMPAPPSLLPSATRNRSNADASPTSFTLACANVVSWPDWLPPPHGAVHRAAWIGGPALRRPVGNTNGWAVPPGWCCVPPGCARAWASKAAEPARSALDGHATSCRLPAFCTRRAVISDRDEFPVAAPACPARAWSSVSFRALRQSAVMLRTRTDEQWRDPELIQDVPPNAAGQRGLQGCPASSPSGRSHRSGAQR